MKRMNFKYSVTLWTTAAMLATIYGGAHAASCKEPENQAVHALFDLQRTTGGPFPSDRFTVPAPVNITGRRVNLPKPDCSASPSDCQDLDVINTLDGFNLQPRLSIPFDGPIDVATATSESIFLISLGNTLHDEDGLADDGDRSDDDGDNNQGDTEGGDLVIGVNQVVRPNKLHDRVIGINQVVWDPLANTLHVQSDELLDQHTRYVLIVTNGVHDLTGHPVKASDGFRRLGRDPDFGHEHDRELKDYGKALKRAINAARASGVDEKNIVSASLFTTQSATAILEKIRDQIRAGTPAPADFRLGPGGTRTIFSLSQMTGLAWNQQTGENPARFTTVALNLSLPRIIPGAVSQIAFGKYLAPDYTVHPGEYIPVVGTRSGTPQVQSTSEVYFNVYLPSGPKPSGGWPVAIVGHGSGSNKNNAGGNLAAVLADHGIASISINEMGHGFGSLGKLTVNQSGSGPVIFPDGGRGFDQNHDGIIESREGDEAVSPRNLPLNRDGIIRTVGDLMQLVRVVEVGMDVDGDGSRDLDQSRIYFFGASLGGIYATIFAAVEPQVRATVANVAGGALIENRRLFTGADSFRSRLTTLLAARQPSLINGPGISRIAGVSFPGPYFNENMPLRNGVEMVVGLEDGTSAVIQSPVVNAIAGAMALQEWFDRAAWAAQAANPVAYAPHLRKSPLQGVPIRPVLLTFAKGDQSMPNPNTTALLRAGDLADRTTFYRHDLAFAEIPGLPKDPHMFTVGIGNLALRPFALEAQRQVAIFFASNGTLVLQPEPARFFEVPIASQLPESLGVIP